MFGVLTMWLFYCFFCRVPNKALISIKFKFFSSPTKAIQNNLFIVYCSACSVVWKQIKNNAHFTHMCWFTLVVTPCLLCVKKQVSNWTCRPQRTSIIILIKWLIKKWQDWANEHWLAHGYTSKSVQPALAPNSKRKLRKHEINWSCVSVRITPHTQKCRDKSPQ